MASAGRVDEPDKELMQWYGGGEMVGLLQRNVAMKIEPEMTHPDMTKRYVITVRRGAWTQKWIMLMDDNRAPDPESASAGRGGLRVVDPLTGALTESVYMGMLRSSSDHSRQEPVVMFRGFVFVRPSFSAELQAAMDPDSQEARERSLDRIAQAHRQRERLLEVRRERRARRRALLTEGDQSSDEEGSDDDSDKDDDKSPRSALASNAGGGDDKVVLEVGDLFQRLLQAAGVGSDRAQLGEWHQYIGCDSCAKKADMGAYPVGERIVAVNDYYY